MIITLIGSKRFQPWFDMWKKVLRLHEHIVYVMPHFNKRSSQSDLVNEILIRKSDAIMLLNKFAYIGQNTMDELAYAIELNKIIIALESWKNGNGIDHKHFKEVQEAAKQYDVWGKMSPINTFNFMDPYNTQVLGPGGELRYEAISIIKQQEIIALGYDSDNLKHYWDK